MSIPKPVLN